MFEYKKEQLQRIENAIKQIKNSGKKLIELDINYLKQFLSIEDIAVFYKMLFENEYRQNINNKQFELSYEIITPYTILGIDERECSKEILLDALQHKLNYINRYEKNERKKDDKINEILDAYNEIIKTINCKK